MSVYREKGEGDGESQQDTEMCWRAFLVPRNVTTFLLVVCHLVVGVCLRRRRDLFQQQRT